MGLIEWELYMVLTEEQSLREPSPPAHTHTHTHTQSSWFCCCCCQVTSVVSEEIPAFQSQFRGSKGKQKKLPKGGKEKSACQKE